MANKRIPFEPDRIYHVYNHGNGSENIFNSNDNYNYFLKKYAQYIFPVAETFAYCLMPNHLHLLIRIRPVEELLKLRLGINPVGLDNLPGLVSRHFSNFFNAYAKAFNKKYDRQGSLFKGDVERKLVHQENYFSRLIAYIHLNPVHHGFVKVPEDWPHSSFHAYLLQKSTKIAKQEGLRWFGGEKSFLQFHQDLAGQDIFKELDL